MLLLNPSKKNSAISPARALSIDVVKNRHGGTRNVEVRFQADRFSFNLWAPEGA